MTAEQVAIGVRRMLRRIRALMSGAGSAQERLDELVRVIAGEMVAEVCTVYVMRAGEVLELFATQGLNASAVHVTRLRVGEGLIGEIAAHARVLNLSDAPAHPQFAYRPETGEDPFRSFLGAPVVKGGRVRGVIAVQNKAERSYSEEEVEALEMIAVVLGALIAGGDLVAPEERISAQGNAILPLRLTGIAINSGLAMGEAVLHRPRVSIPQMFADDTEAEQERLRDALTAMHHALDSMFSDKRLDGGGEHKEVLETFRLIAEDRGWLRRLNEAISGGLTAEAAVQKVQDDMRTRMGMATDPYLRERLYDFEDLGNRLMQHLTGESGSARAAEMPDDVVLIARNMGPAELLDYEPHRLRALVLEEGTAASHVAIVARALDIPIVGRIPDLLSRIDPMDPVVVDGDNAQVFVRPNEDVQLTVAETIRMHEERRRQYRARRNEPPVTMDGIRISLNLNAGLLIDMQQLSETGADGIGLYRTEIPFMVRSEFPSVESQRELYANVLNQANERPVMFRTLDIGGDKQLPYFHDVADQNPFMGWRAIRVALDRPSVLRQQLRALINAARGRDLSVMFPMVSEVAEFDAARALLDKELAREEARGRVLPEKVRVGAMMEVPALLWQLPSLLRRIDFLSVGSNDLFQFLYAVDRGNPRVSDRYDVLSPGVLMMLRDLVRQCDAAKVPLSLCGEMAGRPLEAMTLIGLGFRSISMTPARVGAVRAMTRSLFIKPLAAYLDELLDSPDHSLRPRLRAFAKDHGVVVEEG
jgi:phosphotransferase system enzyme I (PtsP)